jgi:hypothetical protein
MAKVEDRRFEKGDWPIAFEVPVEQADTWFRCRKRAARMG